MKQMAFDLDFDKHYNASLVIACDQCGKETSKHLRSLVPDTVLRCSCGSDMQITSQQLSAAEKRQQQIKSSYRLAM
ncbi:MAG: hypothetical protein U1F63_09160 [Chitinivorax sp.]